QKAAYMTDREFYELTAGLKPSDQLLGFVGCHIGPAHQVGDGKAPESAKPGHGEHPFLRLARPQAFDPFQDFEVTAANFLGHRLQHLAASKSLRCRRLPDDEWLP